MAAPQHELAARASAGPLTRPLDLGLGRASPGPPSCSHNASAVGSGPVLCGGKECRQSAAETRWLSPYLDLCPEEGHLSASNTRCPGYCGAPPPSSTCTCVRYSARRRASTLACPSPSEPRPRRTRRRAALTRRAEAPRSVPGASHLYLSISHISGPLPSHTGLVLVVILSLESDGGWCASVSQS